MKVRPGPFAGILIVEPRVFSDRRGFFKETYHRSRYRDHGIECDFVQDNVSFSRRGTIRGLHYQYPRGQAKLVQVLDGAIWDVAVDIRRGSPSFGRWFGIELTADNHRQVLLDPGLAHGFCVLSETALVHYKCSEFWDPQAEGGVRWNDPQLCIDWPPGEPILSEKDAGHPLLRDIPDHRLPRFEGQRS